MCDAAAPHHGVWGPWWKPCQDWFLEIMCVGFERHWSGVYALHISSHQPEATCSMCVQQCHPIGVLSLKNQCPPCLQKRSPPFCPPADFQSWRMLRKICYLFNLINVFWWCCVVCLKLDVISWVFVRCNRKEFSTKVSLTLNSFSNNTYTSYRFMHIHKYEYIYISFVIAFCGVGYFKGLKHSIFKSCHQIPISVLGTWC